MTVTDFTGPHSSQTLPYPVVLPILHLDHPIAVEGTADVNQGFVFVLERVSVTVVAHGVGRAKLGDPGGRSRWKGFRRWLCVGPCTGSGLGVRPHRH